MNHQHPDGIARPTEDEYRINEAFARVFADEAGQFVLQYLRSITIERISGPGAVDGQYLAHMEGQRYLLAIIDSRVTLGNEKLPEVSRGTGSSTAKRRRDRRQRRNVHRTTGDESAS